MEKEDLLELLHNAIAKDVILKEKKIELKAVSYTHLDVYKRQPQHVAAPRCSIAAP